MTLPPSTVVNKFVAKMKFYEHSKCSEKQRSAFQGEIERITWANKISPSTLNVSAGRVWSELEVFSITLKGNEISEGTLQIINAVIPYPILFVLHDANGRERAAMAYKKFEKTKARNALKVLRYFYGRWIEEGKVDFSIFGMNIDQVYEGFLRQIEPRLATTETDNIESRIAIIEREEELRRGIATLTGKIERTAQENKRFELAKQRAKLQAELGRILDANNFVCSDVHSGHRLQ